LDDDNNNKLEFQVVRYSSTVGRVLLARMDVQHGHAGLALDLAAPDEAAETAFDMSDHLRRENKPKNFEFKKKNVRNGYAIQSTDESIKANNLLLNK
jgi:hypothetical protein